MPNRLGRPIDPETVCRHGGMRHACSRSTPAATGRIEMMRIRDEPSETVAVVADGIRYEPVHDLERMPWVRGPLTDGMMRCTRLRCCRS
jgi:hypothetical protein